MILICWYWLVNVFPLFLGALRWREYQYGGRRPTVADQFISLERTVQGSVGLLRVVRWQRGHPSAHIFLVAPEAGQAASTYWEGRLEELLRIYGRDFCLYAVDLRGTSDSNPFHHLGLSAHDDEDSDDEKGHHGRSATGSANDSDSDRSHEGLRLTDITVGGQAEDLLVAIRVIKEEPGFTGNIYLHARAFGCFIATQAIELNSGHIPLAGALLESPLPVAHGPLSGPSDVDLIDACTKDPGCRKALGMDAAQVRAAIASLASRHLNACTRLLHEVLEKESSTYSRLGRNASDWLRLLELFYLVSRLPEAGSMILLPLVQTTFVCSDPLKYEQQVVADLLKGVIQRPSGDCVGLFDPRGRDQGGGSFVNAWLMLREWFAVGTHQGRRQHACKDVVIRGLASPCFLYRYYRRYLHSFKGLSRRKYEGSLTVPYKIKGGNTKLIFVAGALDMHSPATAAREWHAKSTSDQGLSVHVFGGQAEMPLKEASACVARVGDELLRGSSPEVVESCLRLPEGARLIDWSFKNVNEMSVNKWWTLPAEAEKVTVISASPDEKARRFGSERSGDPTVGRWVILVIVLAAISVIIVGTEIVLCLKRQGPLIRTGA